MIVSLHDGDKSPGKIHAFPNYALMKIAAWHKEKGDTVDWFHPLIPCDKVYSSKVFDFTETNPYLPESAVRGGTGYRDLPRSLKLPQEIDDTFPDYSLYPQCEYAIGFLTRGCPNHCRWCGVPDKEGNIHAYRDWRDVVRPDSKELVLMDNNILAIDHGIKQLEGLVGSCYSIDLNQGMDARLVTLEIAELLAKVDWIRFIRFSCDQKSQIEPIKRCIEYLGRYGVKPYRIFVYLLVTDDLADASYRIEQLKRYKSINLYAMAEKNPRLGIMPNEAQIEFQQRYVYGGSYRRETWEEYCQRRHFPEEYWRK